MSTHSTQNTKFRVQALPAFNDNYVWLIDNGIEAVVVDPGDAKPVLAYLQKNQLTLSAILLTHHHADHIGGVETLLDAFSSSQQKITVYGPILEEISTVNFPLMGDETISIFNQLSQIPLTLKVLSTPGHTRGHLSYFLPAQESYAPYLFCGDTLFSIGCGRLFEGTAQQMYVSLQTLAALPSDTQICCAHEYTLSNLAFALTVDPENQALQQWNTQAKGLRAAGKATIPTELKRELLCNPFLRCNDSAVQTAVTKYAKHHDIGNQIAINEVNDAPTVFAILREWKNRF